MRVEVGVCEFAAAQAVWAVQINRTSPHNKLITGRPLGVERGYFPGVRLIGEEYNVQRFCGRAFAQERVVVWDFPELISGANDDRDLQSEAFVEGCRHQRGDPAGQRRARVENDVSALNVSLNRLASQVRKDRREVFHRQAVFAADIDSPQQGYMDVRQTPPNFF
jgi:hypothetical protein